MKSSSFDKFGMRKLKMRIVGAGLAPPNLLILSLSKDEDASLFEPTPATGDAPHGSALPSFPGATP